MIRGGVVLVILAFLVGGMESAIAAPYSAIADVFVAPSGDDRWLGKLNEADGDSFDGPVATLSRALERLEQIMSVEGDRGRPYVILLRGGTYELDKTVYLGPANSGFPGSPVQIKAYPNERPVLSGGRSYTAWKQDKKRNVWRMKVVASDLENLGGSQIYIADQRRLRTRLPATGVFHMVGDPTRFVHGKGKGPSLFEFDGDDIPSGIDASTRTEIVVFHPWTTSRMILQSIDRSRNLVELTGPTYTSQPKGQMGAGTPYIIENVPLITPSPGSWYYDADNQEIVYSALVNEMPDRLPVIVPRLPVLIRIGSESALDGQIHDVTVQGVAFAYSAWNLAPEGHSGRQAEPLLPAAIEIQNASRVVLDEISLAHTGAHGISVKPIGAEVNIENCELVDIGGGGILIGSSDRHDIENLDVDRPIRVAQKVTDVSVQGCLLRSLGRVSPGSVGIWIGNADHTLIETNTIQDLYYSGISVGWSWSFEPSRSFANIIRYNHITDFGQGVLSDMGGVYTLGSSPGTIVEGNIIERGLAREYGGWGLYADIGSSHIKFSENVVDRTSHGSLHLHFVDDILVEGNRFSDAGDTPIRCISGKKERNTTSLRGNFIIWSGEGAFVTTPCLSKPFSFEHNSYWNGGRHVSQNDVSFDPDAVLLTKSQINDSDGMMGALGHIGAGKRALGVIAGRVKPLQFTNEVPVALSPFR